MKPGRQPQSMGGFVRNPFRTLIARDTAFPLLLGQNLEKSIVEILPEYARQIHSLALAENLISRWSFQIQEKHAASYPTNIKRYSEEVNAWVLKGL